MPYRVGRTETVEEAVQRIGREQVGKALAEVRDGSLDGHETVHRVRKRCKKVRGLLRLVRPALEAPSSFEAENAGYRDAARDLSRVRDARSVLEALDALRDRYAGQVAEDVFDGCRRALVERLPDAPGELDARLAAFAERLEEARARISGWSLACDGFDAIRGGLTRTYGRGRRAMEAAYDAPSSERFHEWRKRTKYHLFHARLLRNAWKPVLRARTREARVLAQLLGHDHDLALLRDTLLDTPAAYDDEGRLRTLLGLALQRQLELRGAALRRGRRLFAETPKAFARRVEAYWDAWREASEAPRRRMHEHRLVRA